MSPKSWSRNPRTTTTKTIKTRLRLKGGEVSCLHKFMNNNQVVRELTNSLTFKRLCVSRFFFFLANTISQLLTNHSTSVAMSTNDDTQNWKKKKISNRKEIEIFYLTTCDGLVLVLALFWLDRRPFYTAQVVLFNWALSLSARSASFPAFFILFYKQDSTDMYTLDSFLAHSSVSAGLPLLGFFPVCWPHHLRTSIIKERTLHLHRTHCWSGCIQLIRLLSKVRRD